MGLLVHNDTEEGGGEAGQGGEEEAGEGEAGQVAEEEAEGEDVEHKLKLKNMIMKK